VKNTGFAYKTATNGLDAVEAFKNERFDAVVMGKFLLQTSSRSPTERM